MSPNMNTGTSIPTTEPSDMDAIAAALGELEIEDHSEPATITEINESEASVIEALDAKDEAMANAEVNTSGVSEAPAESAPAKKERKAKDPSAPKKVRAPRDLNTLDPSVFVLSATTPADLDANKTSVIAGRPAQKKVAEKFDNLFQSLAAGKQPSVYTMACFNMLASKGSVEQKDLVAVLMATNSKKGAGYNEGTARSQAGQMMALLSHVGVAKREKSTLTYISDSPVAAKLKTLPAA
jgi:hypothetical protein